MQAWFQAVLTLNLLFLFINLGFLFIGGILDTANGVTSSDPTSLAGKSIDFDELGSNANNTVQSLNSTGGGFNTAFIFGDFGKAISMFMDTASTGIALLSGGYIVHTLEAVGFPGSFTGPFQAIVLVMNVGAVAYLVSGRW